MKKILDKAGYLLLCIVLTPVCILGGIVLLLYIPVDYVRYHCSAFYKDTRRKYELFAATGHWFRLYNAMRAAELPLDFHLHTVEDWTYGWFRYKNILLVQDFPVEYVPQKQAWFVCYEDEDEQANTALAEALEMSLESYHEMMGAKLCDRAVLLTDRTHIPEEDLPHLESCGLLLGYDGNKGLVPALKQWIIKTEEK